jgi:hypothetical protein
VAHTHILDVRTQPPDIPYACHTCANQKRARYFNAKDWLVCPEGLAIQATCREHGQAAIDEFREKLGEEWTLHPIHHADRADRTTHARGPICGHSTCAQVFIDTGRNRCSAQKRADDETMHMRGEA